jgi:ribonuclease R
VGETFSGRVTGVASFGIFVTLDTLHVEGMVHVSELGTEYFQFNESLHELRGERTGIRYRLTDAVQVQVARVDLEARRIEFRLVTGTSFVALRKASARPDDSATRRTKKAAPTKPEAPVININLIFFIAPTVIFIAINLDQIIRFSRLKYFWICHLSIKHIK